MIFEDPSQRRWKMALIVFIGVAFLGAALIVNIVVTFFVAPPLPSLQELNGSRGRAIQQLIKEEGPKKPGKKNKPLKRSSGAMRHLKQFAREKKLPAFSQEKFLQTAFLAQGDPKSVDDLKDNIESIDMVSPDWYSISAVDCEVNENADPELAKYLGAQNVFVVPRFSNTDAAGEWKGQEFSQLLAVPTDRQCVIEVLKNMLLKVHADGLNLDIESLDPSAKNNFLDWLIELASALHDEHLYLSIDLPVNDEAFDYEAIGQIADIVLIMTYDEHYMTGPPGPIAGESWFQDGIDNAIKEIPKEKIIVVLGNYGYDWNVTKKTPATPLSFDDAMILASEVGADVETDKISINSRFSYQDPQGDHHEVWLLDSISAWNQYLDLREKKVYGVGLWRLGLEAPGLWKFLNLEDPSQFDPHKFAKVSTLSKVTYEGNGEILKVRDLPKNGTRNLTFDGQHIDYASYETLPTNYVIHRYGERKNSVVVLTFDDGPDPVTTPQILDILKKNNIPATFFLVGDQVQRYPDLVLREVNEGHLLGNHTFYHPDLSQVSTQREDLEITMTERLIESITGKQTLLFRAPFSTDSSPTKGSEIEALYEAGRLGYITVGADIDSEDYAKPGVDAIVSNVERQLKETGSHIIVLHDAGGDRSQTVAALPKIIADLKAQGYEFGQLDDLISVPDGRLMQEISLSEKILVWGDGALTWLHTWGWGIIVVLFFLTTILSVLRILFLGFFVLRSSKTPPAFAANLDFTPLVTVVIPAFNEGRVIEKTLRALKNSTYQHFEIIVVNDGSTDDTGVKVNELTKEYSKLRFVQQENQGKHAALNFGFREAKGAIVVSIDADTIILPETLSHLVAPFQDAKVDAVCGNVQVGNVHNLLTGFQEIEYVTTQNYDRRAFGRLNCISVVPGATGAWKKSKVLEVGGYSSTTLTEDADLTLSILEHGGTIVYAADARSITEAPSDLRSLIRQRFRWSFGSLQTLWKHRKTFFHGMLGWIALPNMFLFQILFPILSPIGDLVFLLALFRGDMKAILSGYILFLLMDFAGSWIAYTLEEKPKKHLWLIFIQRFCYRQLMYVITIMSLVAAMKGRRHSWNKIERRANMKSS